MVDGVIKIKGMGPLVFVLHVRGWPSTGLVKWSEQSKINNGGVDAHA